MPFISFFPSGKSIGVPPGTRLSDACRMAGFALPAPCGGKGLCGKCRVRVLSGAIPADSRQASCLSPHLLREGWRAACVPADYGDLIVADPADAAADGVILTEFAARTLAVPSGLWERTVAMPSPSPSDRRDDLSRLTEALSGLGVTAAEIDPSRLSGLPDILRRTSFRCNVVGMGKRLLAVRDGGIGKRNLGLAVDLGTTTIAAALCDLDDGSVLSVAGAANPQAVHGDDVISRMEYVSRHPARLGELRGMAVRALEELADETAGRAGTAVPPLVVAVGANTAMNHFLLGIPTRALAESPFVPAFRGPLAVSAEQIGWRGRPPPLFLILPNIAAHVGGDAVAGLLAHDLRNRGGNVLFLDIGTNGEIVLAAGGRLFACAAAAGPAFEGARIEQGMRAARGAICRVELAAGGMLRADVVESARPARGICGTGLLDAVAALLDAGAIDAGGRLATGDGAPAAGVPSGVAAMLHRDAAGAPAVWLERPAGRGGTGVRLSQKDIGEFQLAKGAIAAGARVLLREANVEPGAVDMVLLAGGFGNCLNPRSAVRAGLLPAGIAIERVRPVGNAALSGARRYLLSGEERAEAEAISRAVRYVELSGRKDFEVAFAEEMGFDTGGASSGYLRHLLNGNLDA